MKEHYISISCFIWFALAQELPFVPVGALTDTHCWKCFSYSFVAVKPPSDVSEWAHWSLFNKSCDMSLTCSGYTSLLTFNTAKVRITCSHINATHDYNTEDRPHQSAVLQRSTAAMKSCWLHQTATKTAHAGGGAVIVRSVAPPVRPFFSLANNASANR